LQTSSHFGKARAIENIVGIGRELRSGLYRARRSWTLRGFEYAVLCIRASLGEKSHRLAFFEHPLDLNRRRMDTEKYATAPVSILFHIAHYCGPPELLEVLDRPPILGPLELTPIFLCAVVVHRVFTVSGCKAGQDFHRPFS
jgi:hypothetical protein